MALNQCTEHTAKNHDRNCYNHHYHNHKFSNGEINPFQLSGFFFVFFVLTVSRPTLGHSRGDSLTSPMLIAAFSTISTQRSPGAS